MPRDLLLLGVALAQLAVVAYLSTKHFVLCIVVTCRKIVFLP